MNFISSQFFTFLAFSLLYASYTANIVSLLQSPSKSIKTIHDLYNSKFQLAMEDTPYGRGVFSKSTDPFLKKVYIEKIAPPGKRENLISAAKGVAMIRQRKLAFLAEENSIYQGIEETFLEHEKCGLVSYLK